jgi:hypothetical protein
VKVPAFQHISFSFFVASQQMINDSVLVGRQQCIAMKNARTICFETKPPSEKRGFKANQYLRLERQTVLAVISTIPSINHNLRSFRLSKARHSNPAPTVSARQKETKINMNKREQNICFQARVCE